MNYAAGGLVGGEHEHFCHLHVRGRTCCIQRHVGYVFARQRFDTFIDVVRPLFVAVETGNAEVGLYESGLDVRNAQGRGREVHTQAVRQGLHRCFGGAIDGATRVVSIASHGANVDDMPFAALDHGGHYEPRHHQKGGDVGLYHRVVVGFVAFVLFVEPEREPCVVDEHVYGLPFCGQALHRRASRQTVADIKGQQ